MKAKYFNSNHPSITQWNNGQSHCWKALYGIREEVENHMKSLLSHEELYMAD